MKLVSYTTGSGPAYGIATDQGIVDLSRRVGKRCPDLKALIAQNAFAEAEKSAGAAPDFAADAVSFLPVIPAPGKILCIGLNYEEHRVEAQRDKTENPSVFVRLPESQAGHRQPLLRPRESEQLDYEGEIAVVIGKPGRRIAEGDAWQHIAGYACYNDGSVRDWQRHTTQWTPGKNFAATGGFGPWMVTADEIPPGAKMTLVTRLNGREMQRADTGMMIFKIPRLIAYCSAFLPLAPGDVIVTGTPGGVGSRRDPPVWMREGDSVEVEVDRIGTLVNTVAAG